VNDEQNQGEVRCGQESDKYLCAQEATNSEIVYKDLTPITETSGLGSRGGGEAHASIQLSEGQLDILCKLKAFDNSNNESNETTTREV
jgi:hypothetical protein